METWKNGKSTNSPNLRAFGVAKRQLRALWKFSKIGFPWNPDKVFPWLNMYFLQTVPIGDSHLDCHHRYRWTTIIIITMCENRESVKEIRVLPTPTSTLSTWFALNEIRNKTHPVRVFTNNLHTHPGQPLQTTHSL